MSVDGTVQAFTRLLDDEEFGRSVARDPQGALAAFDLDPGERAMLHADAVKDNEDEVSGFTLTVLRSYETSRYIGTNIGQISPLYGSLLGSAVDRRFAACGAKGCCAWEGSFC